MDDRSAIHAVPSQPPSTASSGGPTSERVGTELEIAECAKIMLGAYRLAEADDPEIYAGHIRRVLAQYPLWVAKKATARVPDELKWLPAPQEVREICDAIYAPVLREQRRQAVRAETLNCRALPRPTGQKQTYEEFCDEMARRGMPVREADREKLKREAFDLEAFKAKHGVTDAMWDAIPEGDCQFKKLKR